MAEVPYFDSDAPTRREALGLLGDDEKEEIGLTEQIKDFSI